MNAAPTIEERTADAVRRAMAEASAGRLVVACSIAERALAAIAEWHDSIESDVHVAETS